MVRTAIWGCIAAGALALQGCTTAAFSVAGMAGSAVVDHVINGDVHHVIPTPLAGAHLATLATFEQMGMTVEDDRRAGDKWTVLAVKGSRSSKVEISAAGIDRSRVDVQVSWGDLDFIKDPSTANDFIGQMQVEISRLSFKRVQTATAQMLLSDLGYDTDYADGFMDAKTRNAIRRFQRKTGLSPDGNVSSRLIATLRQQPKGRTRTAPLSAPVKKKPDDREGNGGGEPDSSPAGTDG
jgi:hypothetical protein